MGQSKELKTREDEHQRDSPLVVVIGGRRAGIHTNRSAIGSMPSEFFQK
jgi:hypothetical protein